MPLIFSYLTRFPSRFSHNLTFVQKHLKKKMLIFKFLGISNYLFIFLSNLFFYIHWQNETFGGFSEISKWRGEVWSCYPHFSYWLNLLAIFGVTNSFLLLSVIAFHCSFGFTLVVLERLPHCLPVSMLAS